MTTLSWSLNIKVDGGAALTAAADEQLVEALGSITVAVGPGESDKVVDLQPGLASAIHLLLIKSDSYGADFSFKVSDGSSDSTPVSMDAPQVFTGGSVTVFGLNPTQLKFTNASTDQTITVEIFIARDATP